MQQRFKVTGQSVIVTGGASGLGLAFAEAMCSEGARVTIMDMNEIALSQVITRMQAEGHSVTGRVLNVADRQDLDLAFDEVVAREGSLDTVFANAGIDPGPGFAALDMEGNKSAQNYIENYTDDRWDKVMRVNLDGAFYSLRAAARHMRRQKSGSIIITTSISALRPSGGLASAYPAAKAAAAQLMRHLALELAADGVRVNAIAPGPFATNIAGGVLHDEERRAAFTSIVPMGRIAEPDEIKGLAIFLASSASSFITGQQIAIDGGTSLSSARQ
ncbi:SDR family NAD(P)-dependent oxidoreductase [Paraglaciecola chathamensis]|uniref:Tropine dehydrogenase n=1 Tax=Paraglaciecola agarilytica NO2 TaxID=1125747 RepID=A0ABQ0I374_9ALTE|nr:SDR family NAD(P)-dependent oxidoreductase [Paraglaciecola agarilytica]GAC03762.1 tropine dehydrogenase [Paraglaciecola agarilytica NO2]